MRPGRSRLRRRAAASAAAAVALVLPAGAHVAAAPRGTAAVAGAAAVPSVSGEPSGTLLVYDVDPAYPAWSESNATMAANLIGHFSRWRAERIEQYQPGEASRFARLVYVGARYRDDGLPEAFLDDVLAGTTPTLWLGDNLWLLSARQDEAGPSFSDRFGFTWLRYSEPAEVFDTVEYRGRTVDRSAADDGLPLLLTEVTSAPATVVATATGPSRSTPWAIAADHLTYVAELPFSDVAENDRYLVFADLLFDFYGSSAPERHRAIIRLEDVSPNSDPEALRAAVDQLASRNVPFGVHVIPTFVDPDLAHGGANPVTLQLTDRPALVAALHDALARGGELIMHGVTHQAGPVANPYDGISGDDFEFFGAHVDANDSVVLDGAVPGLTETVIAQRLDTGLSAVAAAGLPRPALWTTPHYAGTPELYRALAGRFAGRYERGFYVTGLLDGGAQDLTQPFGQFVPYVVRDVYGTEVLPEDIGNETEAYNQHAARTVNQMIDNARADLVVRDGVAGAFWHPYLAATPAGAKRLGQLVDGVRALGYTYVAPSSLLGESLGGPDPSLHTGPVETSTSAVPSTIATSTTTSTAATTTTTTAAAPATTTTAPGPTRSAPTVQPVPTRTPPPSAYAPGDHGRRNAAPPARGTVLVGRATAGADRPVVGSTPVRSAPLSTIAVTTTPVTTIPVTTTPVTTTPLSTVPVATAPTSTVPVTTTAPPTSTATTATSAPDGTAPGTSGPPIPTTAPHRTGSTPTSGPATRPATRPTAKPTVQRRATTTTGPRATTPRRAAPPGRRPCGTGPRAGAPQVTASTCRSNR